METIMLIWAWSCIILLAVGTLLTAGMAIWITCWIIQAVRDERRMKRGRKR
jgi:uncharacterized protein YpmS